MSDGEPLDEDRFRDFYEATAPPLLSYVRGLLGGGGDAEEVVQEAFLRYLESRPSGLEEVQRRAWVYTAASRLARERRRRLGLARSWRAGEPIPEPAPPEPPVGLDFDRALGRLPVRQRALLWLAYVEGRSHQEIAPILDLRRGSVRVLLFRARRRLEAELRRMGLMKEETP